MACWTSPSAPADASGPGQHDRCCCAWWGDAGAPRSRLHGLHPRGSVCEEVVAPGAPGAWALPSILCTIATGGGQPGRLSDTVSSGRRWPGRHHPVCWGKRRPGAVGGKAQHRGESWLCFWGVFAFVAPEPATSRADRPSPPGGQPCVCLGVRELLGSPGTWPAVFWRLLPHHRGASSQRLESLPPPTLAMRLSAGRTPPCRPRVGRR